MIGLYLKYKLFFINKNSSVKLVGYAMMTCNLVLEFFNFYTVLVFSYIIFF